MNDCQLGKEFSLTRGRGFVYNIRMASDGNFMIPEISHSLETIIHDRNKLKIN
jgi:hypothetical protein